ncbi:YgfZ/GcvT domain-containing protein [Tropicimonas sp.]|uniref:CAF17-like 4Fe-4S cluster assembly/insertion protein YgfZ n=1 Tax=Tropicimonas sp. TaxID=2067044 RepID=UPI003A865328
MTDQTATRRSVLAIGGSDRLDFLQGLVSNDVNRLVQGSVYAALLSPQGKYLADFFLVADGDRVLLDVDTAFAGGLLRRLSMYRLRADVSIGATDLLVTRGLGARPDGAFEDPRHPSLGWRYIARQAAPAGPADWAALRVAACIPESGIELIPDDSYILECGFERLNGVDFRKGCYVGQEVTARMKHKTELRKGLVTVDLQGAAPVGTAIMAGDRQAGTLFTQSGDRAIAFLRFDRATGPMQAGTAHIRWNP